MISMRYSSPPRKRGSRATAGSLGPWIPAFAGMTNKALTLRDSFSASLLQENGPSLARMASAGFGPEEGFGAGIVLGEISIDGGLRSTIERNTPRQMRCRVILEKKFSTALGRGWGEMKGPARMARQPSQHLGVNHRAVEDLDLALFVNRQHDRMGRRIEVEPDDVGELGGKAGIASV